MLVGTRSTCEFRICEYLQVQTLKRKQIEKRYLRYLVLNNIMFSRNKLFSSIWWSQAEIDHDVTLYVLSRICIKPLGLKITMLHVNITSVLILILYYCIC